MESENVDNVSIKSSDSVTTSGEYEIVPDDIADLSEKTLNPPTPGDKIKSLSIDKDKLSSGDTKMTPVSPILNIDGNGDLKDIEKNLNEVIHELDTTDSSSTQKEVELRVHLGEYQSLSLASYFLLGCSLKFLSFRILNRPV